MMVNTDKAVTLVLMLYCMALSQVHGGHLVQRMRMKQRWTKHTAATSYRAGHKPGHPDLDKNSAEVFNIDVKSEEPVFITEDHFISYTLDYSLLTSSDPWLMFNISSPRMVTLVKGLSPAILRVGGTSAGFMFFDVSGSHAAAACLQPTPVVLRKETVLQLAALMKVTGNRFLIDLNIQSRIGTQWNPIDSLKLFDFISSLGLGEIIDWELGNEPEYANNSGQRILPPAEVGNDFLILDRVVRSYPEFSKSRIVGPDCSQTLTYSLGYNISKATVDTAGHVLTALTFHHYYFDGKKATVKDFIDPAKFSNYAEAINSMKLAASSHPTLSIWNGETSDSYNSGTPNVTDRYVSGFLWLDKLGLSARMGVGVVMRQTFHGGHYSLVTDYLQPNPDYWLSLVYKQLVGTQVLDVVLNGEEFSAERAADNTTEASSTRAYAHCTKLNHNPSALGGVTKSYPSGSVTIYALNVSPTTPSSLHLPAEWSKTSTDLYLLTPGEEGLVSKDVLVNGVLMKLVEDQVLPSIKPSTLQPGEDFILPSTSFGFLVIPGAKAKACV